MPDCGTGNLCSAHLARITRCKFLHPLRYLCQFMYLTTVKQVLRNSCDLNYLRKMCGTWNPTLVTCEVGRQGRHAPRPNDVGGQPRFPGARKWVTLPLLVISGLATHGDGLRFIPLHALTTLLSALGAFCLFEPRVV